MEEQNPVSSLMERKLKILQQKNEERKLKLEQRKELKTKNFVEEENINFILDKFEKLNEDILSLLKQIEDVNVPKESLPELFDSCYCKLEEWQKMISLTSHILKIYHKKHFQDKYHELNDKRTKLQQSLIPEKKFSFKKLPKKNVKKETGDEEKTNEQGTDEVDATMVAKISKKYLYEVENEFGFFEKENENLKLNHNEVFKKDVVFRNLKNCQLLIEGGANTIHFVSLKDSRILCGPVSTSVFVENCTNCTFVVACQQLRIHTTYHTDFYIHVTSRAIIEDSKQIRFAPYNWQYDGIEDHFEKTNLNIQENNWNFVNDFNWLSSVPSPNWTVIEENERVFIWN
ncbi:hypothetical protein PGB90_010304 [Kerria lacca]